MVGAQQQQPFSFGQPSTAKAQPPTTIENKSSFSFGQTGQNTTSTGIVHRHSGGVLID